MEKFISMMMAAILTLSLLAGCAGSSAGSVTTDGSTSMEKVIGALGESFQNETGIDFSYNSTGSGSGHVQSLILCALLLMISVLFLIAGIQADLISDNRKLLEDVQYRVRKMEIQLSEEDDQ